MTQLPFCRRSRLHLNVRLLFVCATIGPAATAFAQENKSSVAPPRATTDAVKPLGLDKPLTPPVIAFLRQGDAMLRQGDVRQATAFYIRACLASPRDPVLRLMTGVALSSAGGLDDAARQFRQAASFAGDDLIAALLLQGALAEKGEGAEAQELYQNTIRRFGRPGKSGLDATASIARLNRALAQLPDSAVLNLLLGDAYQLSEEWAKADAAYTKALRQAPLWSKPRVNLGLSLFAQGKTTDAISMLTGALRLDPQNAQARMWKGNAEQQAGLPQDALKSYRSVESDTRAGQGIRAQAKTRAAQVLVKKGDLPQAIAALQDAQKMTATDPTPSALLGQVQVQAGNYNEAADAYKTALRLTRGGGLLSTRPILFRSLAEAQLSARKPADALVTLDGALTEEPESAPLWHRLAAQAHFDKGDIPSGERELRAALDSEPSRYPLDTLNAFAARNLLSKARADYEGDRSVVATGFRSDITASGSFSLSNRLSGGDKGSARLRATIALANIARYENRTGDEIALREELTRLRSVGTDWFLLAEAYDQRAKDSTRARAAYLRAVELGNLPATQEKWARARLSALNSAPKRP